MITALLVLAAGLAACGSSSSSTSTAAGTATQYQARLNLAKCFRAHGINLPDPSANGGLPGGGGGPAGALQNYSQAQLSAAQQACRQDLAQAFPRLNLSPGQQAQFRAQIVRFAQCMRSHGVNIPDPTTNGGGFGFRQALGSVDRNSPAFQAAAKACESLRPRFGRGGPGAPPGGAAPVAPAVGPAGAQGVPRA